MPDDDLAIGAPTVKSYPNFVFFFYLLFEDCYLVWIYKDSKQWMFDLNVPNPSSAQIEEHVLYKPAQMKKQAPE